MIFTGRLHARTESAINIVARQCAGIVTRIRRTKVCHGCGGPAVCRSYSHGCNTETFCHSCVTRATENFEATVAMFGSFTCTGCHTAFTSFADHTRITPL